MPALLERPHRPGPAGVVLVLHEIFGLNPGMAHWARRIAALGHVALCPALFWRQAPAASLDPDGGMRAFEQGIALMRGLDEERAMADLHAALAFARALPGGNGRVAALGFCLGGRLALRLALEAAPDGAVSYHGVGQETLLEAAPPLRVPVLLHLAGRDRFVPPEAQRRIIAAASRDPRLEVVVHPAAEHGFARPGARAFDARAAAVAQARTEALLAATLG